MMSTQRALEVWSLSDTDLDTNDTNLDNIH
jgi:hypothetical protein